MKTTSYTTLRQNLASVLDGLTIDHEPVVVTRSGGQSAVLMSLDDYNALNEMVHLTSSVRNAQRLSESIEQLQSGGGSERTLIE